MWPHYTQSCSQHFPKKSSPLQADLHFRIGCIFLPIEDQVPCPEPDRKSLLWVGGYPNLANFDPVVDRTVVHT